jgi:Na+:H+ antiporter, NhaA family
LKRWLPFLIIALVAVLALGISGLMLRAKKRALADQRPSHSPSSQPDLTPTHTRGPAEAAVTLEEYGDFECPSCAAVSNIVHAAADKHRNSLRLIFWQFPLPMHPHAREAAIAAEAASRQGHFWEMHDSLYAGQQTWSNAPDPRAVFEHYAEELHLDLAQFRKDLDNPEVASRIDAEHEQGEAHGVKATPTLFINGEELPPPFDPERVNKAIATALDKNS